MIRYLMGFFAVLGLCLAIQTAGLQAVGGKTAKSESNYFSSLARLQGASRADPQVLLLGSSLTGRMADRAAAVPGIVNLGCDGGSAAVTLRALDQGLLSPAPVIAIEANTLAYDLDGRGSQMSQALEGEWFHVGERIPVLGATARPTAFAYSWLMKWKDGDPVAVGEALPTSSRPGVFHSAPSGELSSGEENLVAELAGIIGRLQQGGRRVVLVLLPPGEIEGTPEWRVAHALAERSGAEWWDLNDGLARNQLGFTDGRHMDATSAAMTMASLARELLPEEPEIGAGKPSTEEGSGVMGKE
ncbi:hypothetical protein HNR46_003893 [Haloferula luteola]|uniref:SGNH/GDSL hydrolase family protein n=1 Tax=Haloferula luteola TaxID=595692 RepID=A0A840V6N6_9BACT|nr:hypothetical protein [Haloferula luteola]MBB5353632.1 hypothetical protein [Haloferula luteola]